MEQLDGSYSFHSSSKDQAFSLLIIEDPPQGSWVSIKVFGELFQAAKRAMDEAIRVNPIDFWAPKGGELLQLSIDSELDLYVNF